MHLLYYLFLKGLSWVPLRLLYFLGDCIYLLVYYVLGYRKQVVLQNLQIAFPEKSEAERSAIAKAFYHQFIDTFIEMIKLFSWSKEEVIRRFTGDPSLLNRYAGTGKKVEIISGHFFNWELANLALGAQSRLPFLGVYMPLSNRALDKIIFNMRSKTGTILIPATQFKEKVVSYLKGSYALALVADQNPGKPDQAYWMHFFSKPAPFVKGPEKGAKMNNTAVIYVDFYRVRRGYYQYHMQHITDDPQSFADGELTALLVSKIEDAIRQRPSNYLWSHRRWKHTWQPAYGALIEKK